MSATTRALICFIPAFLFSLAGTALAPGAQAADDADVNAPRVAGELPITCTPDEKSKKAGAEAFDDTVTLDSDRVQSDALKAKGFAHALAIPKIVNGVTTVNATFQKAGGGKATYFLRVKKDGGATGSLVLKEGGGQQRFVVTSKGAAAPERANAPAKGKKAKGGTDSAAAVDPAVVRVDGGFVRLMTAQVAMSDAGVTDKTKKAKAAEILKAAGTDQIQMKGAYLSGKTSAAEYADEAGRRLDEANGQLAALLGDKAADLEAAYAKPATGEFLYHNAVRAALAELTTDKARAADQAVYRRMLELALLVRKPAGRDPGALQQFRGETDALVKKSLPAAQWAGLEKTIAGLTSYEPGQAGSAPLPDLE